MSPSDERACATCGHRNRSQARFCEACGRALESRCVTGGNELSAAARFCDACGAPVPGATAVASDIPRVVAPVAAPQAGRVAPAPGRDPRVHTPQHLAERILSGRGALEGERKQVTVLFADVKGSMELAEQVD